MFPTLSLSQVLEEVRKATSLYGVMTEVAGKPTLILEKEIVFQEVVSNSAYGDEPLGTLAGRGVTTGRQKGGHIRIKVTEPAVTAPKDVIVVVSILSARIDCAARRDVLIYPPEIIVPADATEDTIVA